jgi:hypothetical protein
MGNFKPQVSFVTRESYINHRYNLATPYVIKTFNTYIELKKELGEILKEHLEYADEPISVYRSRRGEWGEWFEKWDLVNGKPTIVKQGWQ